MRQVQEAGVVSLSVAKFNYQKGTDAPAYCSCILLMGVTLLTANIILLNAVAQISSRAVLCLPAEPEWRNWYTH